jgi:hypothetical protein
VADRARVGRRVLAALAASLALSVWLAGDVAPTLTAPWWVAIVFRMFVIPIVALAAVGAAELPRRARAAPAPARTATDGGMKAPE